MDPTPTVMGLDAHGRPPPDPDELWLPAVCEVFALAADRTDDDDGGLWLVSRTLSGQPGPWRSGPITRGRGRHGTLAALFERELPGVMPSLVVDVPEPGRLPVPWTHGVSDREDALLRVAGVQLPGAIVLSHVAVIGSHGDLGPDREPMEYVLEAFPHAAPLGPEDAAAVGRPGAHGFASPQPRRLDVGLHGVRALALCLGVRGPDGGWVVEPDAFAAAQLDQYWHRYLGPMLRALAGWYGATWPGPGFEGPWPGQQPVPHPGAAP